MRKIFRLVCCILAVTCALVSAQERLPAEELLRFFPMGDYEEFKHEEMAALLASEHFDFVEKSGSFAFSRWTSPFPEEFLNEAESITSARKVKVFVHTGDSGQETYQKKRGSRVAVVTIGDLAYYGQGVGEALFVFRFIDRDDVLKKYLESGFLTESDESIGSRAVYTSLRKDKYGTERVMYMTVFETGELLAAETPAMLKRMVATGLGEEVSILGDPTYLTVEDALEYKAQLYRWGSFLPLRKAAVKYAEKQDHTSEDLEKARESLAHPLGGLAEVQIWELSDPPIERNIRFFEDEYVARKKMEMWKQGAMRPLDPYSTAYNRTQKFSVDGNQMIATITYDKETVENLRKAREERMKSDDIKKIKEKEKQNEKK